MQLPQVSNCGAGAGAARPGHSAVKPSFSEALQLLHRRLVDRFEAAIAGIPPIQVGSTTIARLGTR